MRHTSKNFLIIYLIYIYILRHHSEKCTLQNLKIKTLLAAVINCENILQKTISLHPA